MIVRCRCGKTWTKQPRRNSIRVVGLCAECRKKNQNKPKLKLSDRPNCLRGEMGRRIRLKI